MDRAGVEGEGQTDRQGNPIDSNGKLIAESIRSVDDIADKDFNDPSRTIQVPSVSEELKSLLPINGRSIVIKRSVFSKNLREHKELTPQQSREVLKQALYSTDMIVHDKPTGKPNYWILVKVGDHNALVNIDTDSKKDNVEVVGWRLVRENSLEQIKNRANRDGGQIIMTREGAAGLSALTTESVFDGKGSESSGSTQENDEKNAGAEARAKFEARVAEVMAEVMAEGRRQLEEAQRQYDELKASYNDAMYEWHRKQFGLPKGASKEEIYEKGMSLSPQEREAVSDKWRRVKTYKEHVDRLNEANRRIEDARGMVPS